MTEEQKRMAHDLFESGWSVEDIAEELSLDEMDVIDYFEENF